MIQKNSVKTVTSKVVVSMFLVFVTFSFADSVSAQVVAPNNCRISAYPSVVALGQPTMLSWDTDGAIFGEIIVSDQNGTRVEKATPDGQRLMFPAGATNYTARVWNSATVTTRCSTGVTVSGVASVGSNTFTGNPFVGNTIPTGTPVVALSQIPYTGVTENIGYMLGVLLLASISWFVLFRERHFIFRFFR